MGNDRQIRQLQQEAAEDGDDMQWLVCERALNAQGAHTRFVTDSSGDAAWVTEHAVPLASARNMERQLRSAGIEVSWAPDHDDRQLAWVYAGGVTDR